jgi:hypothetical protein
MDRLMSARRGAWRRIWIAVGCLMMAIQIGQAQERPTGNTQDATRTILTAKAHALEVRGRPCMAVQLWQQILLSDPEEH